ncbi:TerB family tellurite resistance protein [bacterium 210820-DFI.6.37]|nr:TerB family tellurite resistance protein [bacterium 210820-DFI.6.37]
MTIKDFGKGLKGDLQDAVDTVKQKTKEVEILDMKQVSEVASENIKNLFKKHDVGKGSSKENADETSTSQNITRISVKNAIKTIYFMMAADGEIYHGEEEKFDTICSELDQDFGEFKGTIVAECKARLDKVIDPKDYYDALQDSVGEALSQNSPAETSFITPKILVWNLLSVAYSDEQYNETERRLLKFVVRKLNIDKADFLEMESSMLTLLDLEKELAWIKTTNRPYLTIEAMVNEIADRKNIIMENIMDLVSL